MKSFECKMCGKCCYGKGGITVTEEEVRRISDFLDITPGSFVSEYCEYRNGKLTIMTGTDGFCVFYDRERGCLIHDVKPGICFLWPFYPANINDEYNWDLAKDACPGINPECTFEEFVEQAKNKK